MVALLSLASSARAEQIDNPEYTQWAKFKPGAYTTLKQSTAMAGSSPAGMRGAWIWAR